MGQKRTKTVGRHFVSFGPQSDISKLAEAERRNLYPAIFFCYSLATSNLPGRGPCHRQVQRT